MRVSRFVTITKSIYLIVVEHETIFSVDAHFTKTKNSLYRDHMLAVSKCFLYFYFFTKELSTYINMMNELLIKICGLALANEISI